VALFDNAGPNNLHAEPTIAAARAGKHLLCEKPLARTAAESHDVWQAAARAGVKRLCAFNYRFVPGSSAIAAGLRSMYRPRTARPITEWKVPM
jgi:predicted dehydrogenase